MKLIYIKRGMIIGVLIAAVIDGGIEVAIMIGIVAYLFNGFLNAIFGPDEP